MSIGGNDAPSIFAAFIQLFCEQLILDNLQIWTLTTCHGNAILKKDLKM